MFDWEDKAPNLTCQVDNIIRNAVAAERLHVDCIHNPIGGGRHLPTTVVPLSVGVRDPAGSPPLEEELLAVLVAEEQASKAAALMLSGDARAPQTPTAFRQKSVESACSYRKATRRRNTHLRRRGLAALSPTAF